MGSAFYKYYDSLFQNKDYKKETDLILELHKKFSGKKIKKVLEIGCGTGNHTLELAKNSFEVTSLDIDQHMIDIAEQKVKNLKNVRILNNRVESLEENDFDLVLAMFNVVTYIKDFDSLLSFFKGVSSTMSKDAIFVFDAWNGIAVINDPPKSKLSKHNLGDLNLEVKTWADTDFFNQTAKLNYEIKVFKDQELVESDNHSFDQALWTPIEIKYALEKEGLRILLNCPFLDISRSASKEDWKIMYCCSKS